MSFIASVTAAGKRHVTALKKAHQRHIKAGEKRAEQKLVRLTSKTERDKVRLRLAREKTDARREYTEAQTAAKKAEAALKKARREAGDVGVGERLAGGLVQLSRAVSSSGRAVQGFANRPRASRPIKREQTMGEFLWGSAGPSSTPRKKKAVRKKTVLRKTAARH